MKVDAASARALQAVIDHDLQAIDRINARADTFEVEHWSADQRDSAAYQLHNIYNALENSFIQVSRTFENHITQPERWHRELVEKMHLDLEPIRPALLPESSRRLVRDLLAFRHLFRHAYEFDLDAAKLANLLADWREGREPVLGAMQKFSQALGRVSSAGN